MEAEPTDPTLGTFPSLVTITWAPGDNHWSQLNNGTGNNTTWADHDWPFFNFGNIVSLVTLLVCLCGAAGNGTRVWLLGFHLKRSPSPSTSSIWPALTDGICLLCTGVWSTLAFLHVNKYKFKPLIRGVWIISFFVGLGLLMAISTKRCVSVLCPLWYRCRRLAHLSWTVCMFIWGLGLCGAMCVHIPCGSANWVYVAMVIVTFPMLCISNVVLFMQVQCNSRGTRLSRLYMTILVNILAFMLLVLPFNVYFFVFNLSSVPVDSYALLPILELLLLLNCTVNPVIYFFMGRYQQWLGRMPHQEVLQRVLQDEEEADL